MAGDWIKMRDDLYDDPAVISIGASTGLDEYGVVGRLHKLWSWADRHSLDGNALSVTRAWIDRYLSCDNFADSLFQAGWLVGVDGALSLHNFDRHNGETAKKRAQTNKRVAEHREKQRNSNADSVTHSVTESVTREEKRREEKKEPDARASRLPESWIPDADDVEFCVAERPDLDVSSVADQFRDYWVAQPGAKGRKLDWRATWRNWVRNQKRGFQNGHQGNTKGLVL
jgi:hypothetical protein